VGAAAAGKARDKYGRLRVATIALWGYGAGYTVLIFTSAKPLIAAAIPFVAFGGGALMTLAYAILMPLMPEGGRGRHWPLQHVPRRRHHRRADPRRDRDLAHERRGLHRNERASRGRESCAPRQPY
jgi:hypothetical protein